MASILVKNGELVAAPDTLDNNLALVPRDLPGKATLVFIEVVTSAGGIRFSQGETVDDTKHRAWPAGSKFPMTYRKGTSDIYFKATAAGDTFTITW